MSPPVSYIDELLLHIQKNAERGRSHCFSKQDTRGIDLFEIIEQNAIILRRVVDEYRSGLR